MVGQLQRSVVKVGDSCFVSLPARWLRENGVGRGQQVSVDVLDGMLVIRPQKKATPEPVAKDVAL